MPVPKMELGEHLAAAPPAVAAGRRHDDPPLRRALKPIAGIVPGQVE